MPGFRPSVSESGRLYASSLDISDREDVAMGLLARPSTSIHLPLSSHAIAWPGHGSSLARPWPANFSKGGVTPRAADIYSTSRVVIAGRRSLSIATSQGLAEPAARDQGSGSPRPHGTGSWADFCRASADSCRKFRGNGLRRRWLTGKFTFDYNVHNFVKNVTIFARPPGSDSFAARGRGACQRVVAGRVAEIIAAVFAARTWFFAAAGARAAPQSLRGRAGFSRSRLRARRHG